VDAVLAHDGRDELLALRMMNELRLEFGEDCRDLLRGHVLVDQARIVRREGFFQHGFGQRRQSRCAWRRREDDDLTRIDAATPLIIADVGIEKDGRHFGVPLRFSCVARREHRNHEGDSPSSDVEGLRGIRSALGFHTD
jgi:hypothetical protein